MKKYLSVITILLHLTFFAQTHYDSGCFLDKKYDLDAVSEFKDKLMATVHINVLTLGTKTYNIEFNHSEEFNTETSLIRINDTIAIKISMVRIIDYGRKKYLQQLVLLKYRSCWKDVCIFSWQNYKLGTMNSAYSSGNKEDNNYLGIEGMIKIE